MRPDMKSIEMKFQPTIKEVLFILLFIAGEMKWNFASGEGSGQGGGEWSEKNGPSSKSQLFLFWWTKRMCSCSLSYDFISGSLYMIFYPPKWNFIFVKMAAMKHHQQYVSFRVVSGMKNWPDTEVVFLLREQRQNLVINFFNFNCLSVVYTKKQRQNKKRIKNLLLNLLCILNICQIYGSIY